ncbi:crotonase/enoyl-CoA hydratase family protein [Amycolatopsis taiwanensis]|uniref:Enoyl-CoA hydratase n=1 Tax=Amycolatopsis taiwanensis TaxID=342230 RepID=A0A9W6QY88_9PSEU|nr:crotonase/enoyl-CoA hydratase family protein [Amycolatopsis taiwanensis]GLY64723.1 enoyl-CoA hydratase [Amycolatopsis taiwanensis]
MASEVRGEKAVNEPVLVSKRDGVTVLTLNRPESRNALSDDVVDAVEDAVHAINADLGVRAVILTGAGSVFSSGGNVKDMRQRQGMFQGSPAEIREGYRRGIQRIPRALYHCEVPTIAAVNGPAIGAGLDLALMCDIRIASTAATFAESFLKLGIVPGDGGAWFLPRVVGLSRACTMTYTAEAIDAATAEQWGLVSHTTEPGDLLDAAHDLARRIATHPPHALRMTKRLLREGQHQSLESTLELSAALQALAHHTVDHQEAIEAMFGKRPPRFTGK